MKLDIDSRGKLASPASPTPSRSGTFRRLKGSFSRSTSCNTLTSRDQDPMEALPRTGKGSLEPGSLGKSLHRSHHRGNIPRSHTEEACTGEVQRHKSKDFSSEGASKAGEGICACKGQEAPARLFRVGSTGSFDSSSSMASSSWKPSRLEESFSSNSLNSINGSSRNTCLATCAALSDARLAGLCDLRLAALAASHVMPPEEGGEGWHGWPRLGHENHSHRVRPHEHPYQYPHQHRHHPHQQPHRDSNRDQHRQDLHQHHQQRLHQHPRQHHQQHPHQDRLHPVAVQVISDPGSRHQHLGYPREGAPHCAEQTNQSHCTAPEGGEAGSQRSGAVGGPGHSSSLFDLLFAYDMGSRSTSCNLTSSASQPETGELFSQGDRLSALFDLRLTALSHSGFGSDEGTFSHLSPRDVSLHDKGHDESSALSHPSPEGLKSTGLGDLKGHSLSLSRLGTVREGFAFPHNRPGEAAAHAGSGTESHGTQGSARSHLGHGPWSNFGAIGSPFNHHPPGQLRRHRSGRLGGRSAFCSGESDFWRNEVSPHSEGPCPGLRPSMSAPSLQHERDVAMSVFDTHGAGTLGAVKEDDHAVHPAHHWWRSKNHGKASHAEGHWWSLKR